MNQGVKHQMLTSGARTAVQTWLCSFPSISPSPVAGTTSQEREGLRALVPTQVNRDVGSAGRPHSGPPSGCWCPAGQVLAAQGQCVWPRQCPCLVDGSHYWPGQRIKTDCQLCVCQDGRPRRCQPSPDCAGEPHPEPSRGALVSPRGLWSPPDRPASPSPDSWPLLSELRLVSVVPLG